MHPDPDALPFLDEHGVEIAAPPEVVWESLCRVAEGSFSSPRAAGFARWVGCEETAASGPRPLPTLSWVAHKQPDHVAAALSPLLTRP